MSDPWRADPPLLGDLARITDPVRLVDLDDRGGADPPADRIRIGIATSTLDARSRSRAAGLDLTLTPAGTASGRELVAVDDPETEACRLRALAETNPQATLSLAEVLRAAPREVSGGLALESFAYSTLLGGKEFARWLDERGHRPPPPPAPRPAVLTERTDDTLRITFDRPERRNAYGRELRDALVESLRLALLDPGISRVVLDGNGPSFSSGGDLGEFGTTPDLATAHFIRTRAGAGALLHELADRVEVHLHGSCVGAGIELPAFAGRVLARDGTTFRLPEVGMGLIPGAGGTVSLPRRIGRWRTLYLALSGSALPMQTALEWGLVDAVERSEGTPGGSEPPCRSR